MGFLDENYLLESGAARELYSLVKDLPILDAHNHADIQEIVKNEPWSDIWIVEGATDHYVWEVLRKRGIPEEEITGSASNKEKWDAMASVFPELIGNPTYEWIHLDLRRRFGIQDTISAETADAIWERTRDQLNKPEMRPQSVLKDMKVEIMCTTDNPTVQLPYHEQARTEIKDTKIFPTWRPDKVMNVDKESWRATVENLGEDTNTEVSTLSGVLEGITENS